MPGPPPISEADAARLFVNTIATGVRANWPAFRKALKEQDRHRRLRLPTDSQAQVDLFVAVLAVEVEALPNLFPADQAARLREHTLALCDQSLGSRYRVRKEVAEYHCRWDASLRYPTSFGPDEVSYLCEKWGAKVLSAEMGPDDTVYFAADPLLDMALKILLTDYHGVWKRIKEQFQVTP